MVNHMQFYKITQIPKDVSPVFIQGGKSFMQMTQGRSFQRCLWNLLFFWFFCAHFVNM